MLIFWSIVFGVFCLAVYFAPSFVAIGRKHSYVLQITLLNALLGWSFFGWAAALIWATTKHTDKEVSTTLSWVIISIFLAAILFPILFFSSIFSFTDINSSSNGIQSSSTYRSFYYKIPGIMKNDDKVESVNKKIEEKSEDKAEEKSEEKGN